MKEDKRAPQGRRRPSSARSKNTFVTKSGQTIKINRNLRDRIQARRDSYARKRAARLAGLPKSRIKRTIYRMHPKRLYKYWFSREGAIMALKITGIAIITGFLLLVGVFAYFRKDLPNIKDISGNNIGGSVLYYDRTGQTLLWEDVNGVKRIPVQDSEMSQYIKDATIAVEDKDFFKHGGFDVRGIARAGYTNLSGGTVTQGGSTLTQQLVKLNNDWTKDRTIKRKIKELILAIELERSYSKKEILTGYLNAAPYGGVEYGVEAAARNYFQKSAKDLTLDESAMLASIPKSPTYFSPYNGDYFDKEAFDDRQDYVLDLMAQQGYITNEQRDEAMSVDTLAKVKPRPAHYEGIRAPYFVLLAKEQLEQKVGAQGVKRGGWKVTTTLDLAVQSIAEEQVQKGLVQVKRQGGDEIGFAAEDVKTGQMVALVGGVDFSDPNHGQNNYARLKISPGSSFKPYDYAALIENTTTYGAGSVLYDTKGPLPGYPCTSGVTRTGNCAIDYDLRFPGPLSLRYALGGSRNIPAMKAMLSQDADPSTSVNKTIDLAKKLMQSPGSPEGEARGDYKCLMPGTAVESAKDSDETQCGASSAIGDGAYLHLDEHVHGFGTLSRNGVNIPQTYILKIEDQSKKVIDEWKPSQGVQAIRAETAYIVDDMISDPNASYLASKPHRYKGWKFGYKTGTTNDSKDGLMMGISTQYAAGVWVGYHDRTKAMTGFMENMTQPIMQGFMNKAHDNLKPEDRVKPAGIQTLPAFVVRTHVGVGSVEPSPATDLYPSWFKAKKKTDGKKVIDLVSNKIATDCTPARAKKDVNEGDASSFSTDAFAQGTSATEEKDDIHKCEDQKPGVSLRFKDGTDDTVIADVTPGTHALSSAQYPGTVNFIVDNQVIRSFTIENQGTVEYKLDTNFAGIKTIYAEVVDSVLYDNRSNGIDITGSGGSSGSPFEITTPTENQDVNAGTTTISWSGGSGTFTVLLNNVPVASCTNIVVRTCSVTLPGPNNTSFTAKVNDSTSNSTPTRTFKK